MTQTSIPAPEVLIMTRDPGFGMNMVVSLRSTPYGITVVDPGGAALADAASRGKPPAAAVVELTGSETVVELRKLLRSWPSTRCLFVVRDMPLSAALARIIVEHGGVILSREEPAIVVTATLVAMMRDTEAQEA